MKRAIIVHCWSGYPEYCWYPNAKQELEKASFEVRVPAMPDTDAPNLGKWLPKLKEIISKPDKDLYLIGHSIGCATIMRYLESLTPGEKIGGAVFVAGFTDKPDAKKYPEIQNFFTTPINYEKIKSHCSRFVAIASDNDPYVPLREADALKENLGAEVIAKHEMEHFEADCIELPDVTQAVLKLAKS